MNYLPRLNLIVVVLLMAAAWGLSFLVFAARHADTLAVSPRYLGFYFGLPGVVLLAALLAMLLPRDWRTSAAATLMAVIVAVYSSEAWLTFIPGGNRAGEASDTLVAGTARRLGLEVDRRTMATVVRDLRLAGKPAFPLLGPWEWLVHQSGWTGDGPIPVVGGSVFPLGGIPLATNVYCNETGQWFIYESDRYGFNNPDAIWSGGAPDLAIVGNSWALGACLPNGAAFPDRLRSRAPSLLNLSAGATGPLIRLGLVGEYASLVRPRTVLWLATAPDFTIGMAMEKEVPVLRRYLSGAKQGLPSLAADIGDYQKAYADRALPSLDQRGGARQRAPIRLAEFARLTKLRERLSLVSCPARSTDFAMFGKALSVARDSVAGWGGQLVFVFLPAWSDCDLVNPRASDNWLNRSIRRTAADAGIPVIDLYDLLAEQADPEDLYLYQGGHFSPKGADAAAKFIVERLKTLGRLP